MRYLLDTNVVVWLLLGRRDAVPEHVRRALSDPANDILVSAASVWEIAIKRSLGKLEIADHWRATLNLLDLTPLPVTADHAAGVAGPPWVHRDPVDRLLTAQARAEQATLVTADRTIPAYDVLTFWATD